MPDRVSITRDGPVAVVTMNRADKRNALDLAQIEALVAAGESLRAARDVRAVVLTGAGASFCAGLDVAAMPEIARLARETGFTTRSHGRCNLFQAAAMVWTELPQPVIAAVAGHALGGGFQVMLGADIRIAAPGTQFSIMEARWGLVPDMGGMVLMPRLARADVIRRLTYTAEVFGAEDAAGWGFVTEIAEDPLDRAIDLAGQIAARSPDAVRAAKRLISETALLPAEAALAGRKRRAGGAGRRAEPARGGDGRDENRPPRFTD